GPYRTTASNCSIERSRRTRATEPTNNRVRTTFRSHGRSRCTSSPFAPRPALRRRIPSPCTLTKALGRPDTASPIDTVTQPVRRIRNHGRTCRTSIATEKTVVHCCRSEPAVRQVLVTITGKSSHYSPPPPAIAGVPPSLVRGRTRPLTIPPLPCRASGSRVMKYYRDDRDECGG